MKKIFMILLILLWGAGPSAAQKSTLKVGDERYPNLLVEVEEELSERERLVNTLTTWNRTNLDMTSLIEVETEKLALIVDLMELNGAIPNLQRTLINMVENLPEEELEQAEQIFSIQSFIPVMIPIYNKYYSKEELQGLVDFYKSDVGQKIVKISPIIAREVVEASAAYVRQRREQIKTELLFSGGDDMSEEDIKKMEKMRKSMEGMLKEK